MEELLEFLRDKCSKGLEEAKKCVDPSLRLELEGIQAELGKPRNSSSTPVKLKDDLYDLISTLTDITISHTHNRPVRIFCFPLQIRSRRNTQKKRLQDIGTALRKQLGQGLGTTTAHPMARKKMADWGEDGAGSEPPGEGTNGHSSNEKKVECSGPKTLPKIEGDKILGFGDKRDKIEECLNVKNTENREGHIVQNRGHIEIGIVGMCGSGKTTLAQLVYEKVEFEHKIWVNLPHKLTSNDDTNDDKDFVQILREILKQCDEDKVDHRKQQQCDEDKVDTEYGKQQLLRIIRKRLLGKSYLLVLDGVWDADMDWYFELGKALDWHYKEGDFGKDGSKSAVIITTRLEEPAKTMVGISASALHHIHPQDFSTCWSIFIDEVKRGGKIDADNARLLELENDIKEQCDGLPLAAVTLAKIIPNLIRQPKEQGAAAQPGSSVEVPA
ncbi:Disease resistance RPP13-like protein 4 [Vitis vinifera]|uniref:Disease resistance RPP13-like protein 4 n=1 Tax=Vitis vinifera TaxID=29760 RepID=A0A438IPC1_VITVI|nr:Disease resistance RPP13-like protein 4 [Vitis vinifera]